MVRFDPMEIHRSECMPNCRFECFAHIAAALEHRVDSESEMRAMERSAHDIRKADRPDDSQRPRARFEEMKTNLLAEFFLVADLHQPLTPKGIRVEARRRVG